VDEQNETLDDLACSVFSLFPAIVQACTVISLTLIIDSAYLNYMLKSGWPSRQVKMGHAAVPRSGNLAK
jgi:hypothetical protein